MSGINVVLSAQTQKYVSEIKRAQTEGNKSFGDIGKKAGSMGAGVTDAFNLPGNAVTSFLGRLGPVAGAIGVVGGAAFGAGLKIGELGAQAAESQKKLESLANQSKMTVEQIQKIGIATQTVGIGLDELGDIGKDTLERIGNYSADAAGPLSDFFNMIKGKSDLAISDLQGIGSVDALRLVQRELDNVGASTEKQIFIMEGLASNASKLIPILRKTDTEIEKMAEGYATAIAQMSKQTMTDINRLSHNTESLSQNFKVAMTEQFRSLMNATDTTIKYLSDRIEQFANRASKTNVASDYMSGKTIDPKNMVDSGSEIRDGILAKHYDEADRIARERVKEKGGLGSTYGSALYSKEIANERSQIQIELAGPDLAELNSRIIEAADKINADNIRSDSKNSGGGSAPITTPSSNQKDLNKDIKANADERIRIQKQMGELEIEIENTVGEQSINAKKESYGKLQALLIANNENRKVLLDQQSKLSEEHAQKRLDAQKYLAKNEEDVARYSNSIMLKEIEKSWKDGLLTDSQYGEAKIIAAQKLADDLLAIEKRASDESDKIKREAFAKEQAIREGKLYFLTEDQAKADAQLEIEKNAAEQRRLQLNADAGEEVISKEELNLKLGELDRNYKMDKWERENEDFANEYERNIAWAEENQILLDEQLANKEITESDHAARSIANEKKITDGKKGLLEIQFANYNKLFSGISGLAEKGSKEQRALFAVEKAGAIAQLTMDGFVEWGKAKTWGDKARVLVEYGAMGAQLAAVTLGQFHDGTDEVSSTGSYILQSGERVVQAEANKDLTSYLESNKSNSGGISISAPVTIEGNIDEGFMPKFQAALIEQQEMISHLVRQDQSNRGG
ncbi:hypothetical protein ACLHZU_03655 [Aeromonas salmonicida]|uniref:hypothetical protein n=1 Tax=Aeromonas salmonicida TaxID=645 RepID=UPI003D048210